MTPFWQQRFALPVAAILAACHSAPQVSSLPPLCLGLAVDTSALKIDSAFNAPWLAHIPKPWTVHTRDIPGEVETWSGYVADSQWVDVTLSLEHSDSSFTAAKEHTSCTVPRLGQDIALTFYELTNYGLTTYGAHVVWPIGWVVQARANTARARDEAAALAILVEPDSAMLGIHP